MGTFWGMNKIPPPKFGSSIQSIQRNRSTGGNKDDSFNRVLEAITSGVLILRPGDVVCLNNWVYHTVLLGCYLGTVRVNRWGGIFGNVIVRRETEWTRSATPPSLRSDHNGV